MAWITPITNWTSQNYFNYADWNRIENNCAVLATLLQTCGYNVVLTTITNRVDGSTLDFYDSLNRIEGNILALYNCFSSPPAGWVAPKTAWSYDQAFSFSDTNRIEGNELALYNQTNGIIQEYIVCGQGLAICGMVWQN